MPQGGVDKGEKYYEAAKRELEEETSIKSIKLIKEIDGYITYYLPNNLLELFGVENLKVKNKMVCS